MLVQNANWKEKVTNGVNGFLSAMGLKESDRAGTESSIPYRVILDAKNVPHRPNYSVVMEHARDRGVSVAFIESAPKSDQYVPRKFVTEEGVLVFDANIKPLDAMTAIGEHIAMSKIATRWKNSGLENPLDILRGPIAESEGFRDSLLQFIATRNPELADSPFMKQRSKRRMALHYNLFGGRPKVEGQEVEVRPMNGLETDIGRLTFLSDALRAIPNQERAQLIRSNQTLFSKFFVEMRTQYENMGWSEPLPAKPKKGARNIFGTQKANKYVEDVATYGQEKEEKGNFGIKASVGTESHG